MTAHALVDVTCPHCQQHFIENARLVRPGGTVYCTECSRSFPLDERIANVRRTLQEASLARRRRKERLAELRQRWCDVAPATPPPPKPMQMSDVLRQLDSLLARMDGLQRKEI